MRTLLLSLSMAFTLTCTLVVSAVAQDMGCCQFVTTTRPGSTLRTRACDNLTKSDCLLTKPVSTFFSGLECDFGNGRCVQHAPPRTATFTFVPTTTSTPTQTATPTRTPTITPTNTPTIPIQTGCCQLDNITRLGHPICGNQLTEASCRNDFEGQATFCLDCDCSSHGGPGIDFTSGVCVKRTATPTRTPTKTPTPTFTPHGPIGCCQLEHLRRVGHPVCGNEVTEASCLNDFEGDASFCLDCLCSSHPGPGFEFGVGLCIPRTPTPTRTPTLTPTITPPPSATPITHGCCQLDNASGLGQSICGNDIQQSSCLNDFDGEPTFCPTCVCSSHNGAGFTTAPGACVRPARRPHVPHSPHAAH